MNNSIQNERFDETAESMKAIVAGASVAEQPDPEKIRILSAMNRIKASKNGSVLSIPITMIDLTKNLRGEDIVEDSRDFLQLVESIRELGLLQRPIITTAPQESIVGYTLMGKQSFLWKGTGEYML